MDLDDLLVEGEAFLLAHPLADREQLRKYLMRFEPEGVRDEHIRHGVGVIQRGRPKVEDHRSYHALRGDLASPSAVEDHPHGEVLAEVLEAMLGPGGHEQKVA